MYTGIHPSTINVSPDLTSTHRWSAR